MQTVYVLKSIPAAGKSSYCRQLMEQEPTRYKRINNDDLRSAFDFGVYSSENEKIIRKTRDLLLKEFLGAGYDVLHDNVNAGAKNYDEIVKVVKELNLDITVKEVPIFVKLGEAIERDSKREGKAKVGAEVIKRFWKQLGGNTFKNYVAKEEVFYKQEAKLLEQDENLPRAVIWDNDGTISLIHSGRTAYDASTCDLDIPHKHAIECMRLYFEAGYKVIFVSGREEKDRAPTERFYQKYFPEVEYELYMRPTGDKRKDVLIKEEIYNNHIKGKYFVAGWYDDRAQIVKWLYQNNFPVFRLGDPDASF